MKSEAEIRSRLKTVLLAEFDRRVAESRERLPWLCVHNHQQPLDARKTVDGEPNENYNRITQRHYLPVVQKIGLCMLGASEAEEWPGDRICEDPIDAKRCPDFTPRRSKQDLLLEFQAQMNDPEWLEQHLPAAASLLWMLGEHSVGALPWWKKLWFRFVSVEVEPVQKSTLDLALLLPERADDPHP